MVSIQLEIHHQCFGVFPNLSIDSELNHLYFFLIIGAFDPEGTATNVRRFDDLAAFLDERNIQPLNLIELVVQ
jgi:hypothetical protein